MKQQGARAGTFYHEAHEDLEGGVQEVSGSRSFKAGNFILLICNYSRSQAEAEKDLLNYVYCK